MDEHKEERLILEIRQSHERIRWLEQEILRLKMLLEGRDVMMNSLRTTPPESK